MPFFQCRLFLGVPVPRSARPKAEYRLNEIAEAPPSRRQRVGLLDQRGAHAPRDKEKERET